MQLDIVVFRLGLCFFRRWFLLEHNTSNNLMLVCTDSAGLASVSYDQDVVEGGPDITLECIAIGKPGPPNITWTRVLDNGNDSNVLFTGEQFVLANNRSSIGTYRCTAFNGIGTAPNRTIAVNVNCKLFIFLSIPLSVDLDYGWMHEDCVMCRVIIFVCYANCA